MVLHQLLDPQQIATVACSVQRLCLITAANLLTLQKVYLSLKPNVIHFWFMLPF